MNNKDDISFHTVAIPRLYDAYIAATANMFNPDNDKAAEILTEMRNRIENALAIVTGLPIERTRFEAALRQLTHDDDADPVQVALEALGPYAKWRAVTDEEAIAIDEAAQP